MAYVDIPGASWSLETYPCKFAGLLSESMDVTIATLAHMEATWKAWMEAADVEQASVQKWRRQSFLNWPFNSYIFRLCATDNFLLVPAVVKDILMDVFPNGATKAVEDAFHVERVQEQKSQASRLISPQTAWVSPVQRKVLGSLHSYEEIAHAHISLGADDPKQIPRDWYFPKRADLSDPKVSNIVSARQIPSWPTFTPQSSLSLCAELVIMRHASAESQWHLVCNSWLSCLLDLGMVVRRSGTKRWWMSLGSVRGMAGLGLAVEGFQVSGQEYFTVAVPVQFEWLPILDVGDWQGCLVQWQSPLHLLLQHASPSAQAMLMQKGVPVFKLSLEVGNILETAARACFHNLNEAALMQIATYRGARCVGNLFDKLWCLITHTLPSLSDQEVLTIMSRRLQRESCYGTAFFEQPVVQEAYGEEDAKELESHLKETKDTAKLQEVYTKTFTEKSVKLKGASGGPGPSRGRGRGRGRGRPAKGSSSSTTTTTIIPPGTRLAPQLEVHEFTVEEARGWLPAFGCPLSKDLQNGRWLVAVEHIGTRSRSFQLHGERRSLAMVLRFAHEAMQPFTGHACPHDWIVEEGAET
jgi:hypothetical protein